MHVKIGVALFIVVLSTTVTWLVVSQAVGTWETIWFGDFLTLR